MMTEAMIKNVNRSAQGFAFSKFTGFQNGTASIEAGIRASKDIIKSIPEIGQTDLAKLREYYAKFKDLLAQ